jgi:RNA polymerase sigma-70 factor (ECF subfamily)
VDLPVQSDRTSEFVRLLSAHEQSLVAFVLALVPSWNDASDITQDVRLRLWEQFDQYDSSKDFGTWARTIAYWQVLRWRKETSRRPDSFGPEFLELIAKHVEVRGGMSEERASALSDCLQKLNPTTRTLVKLYYSGKKSARELSDELGKSFHIVRHTLRQARLTLADCVAKSLAKENR